MKITLALTAIIAVTITYADALIVPQPRTGNQQNVAFIVPQPRAKAASSVAFIMPQPRVNAASNLA